MSDWIVSSNLKRAVQTATAISKHTHVPVAEKTDGLHPWHLGEIEGQPTMSVLKRMNDMILRKPNVKVPGRGPQSSYDGESFNSFKRRALSFISGLMAHHEANPTDRTIAVTHYRVMRLLEAWARKGFPKDFSIDAPHMTGKGDAPGSVHYLRKTGGGKWKPSPLDMKHGAALPKGGIFPVRHGVTAWNEENSQSDASAPEPDELGEPSPLDKK